MLVPEYKLDDESTWNVIPAPYVDPTFLRGLHEIGGMNPHGKPMLQLVWGATHRDPQSASSALKYLLSNSPSVLKGFEYVEKGVTHRVKKLEEVPSHILIPIPKYDAHELGQRRFIVERWRSPEFLAESGRYSEEVRRDPESGEVLLREFPRQGVYDCFFIIETADGLYHPPDGEALQGIRLLWEQEKKSFAEKEIAHKRAMELNRKEVKRRQNEAWANA